VIAGTGCACAPADGTESMVHDHAGHVQPPEARRLQRLQHKELIAVAPDQDLEQLDDELERVKWYLWHGNVFQALQVLEGVQWELEDLDDEVRASGKLARAVAEFHG
jgi:hypothetical protein